MANKKENFVVLKGGKLDKEEQKRLKNEKLERIYLKQFNHNFFMTLNMEKAAFYGVRYGCIVQYSTKTTMRDMEKTLTYMSLTLKALETLTFRQFITIFPPRKTYDPTGKWGMKDYYYVMEVLQKYNLDEVMGDRVVDFISEYDNIHTTGFFCKRLAIYDHYMIRELHQKPLLEQFFDIMDVHPQTIIRDEETGLFYDKETGEEIEVAKKQHRNIYNFKVVSKET